MPRANRHFLPGHVWHITINAAVSSNRSSRSIAALRSKRSNPDFHQRFKVQNFLKFARDQRRYLRWVFEAKKRFGLSEGENGTGWFNFRFTMSPITAKLHDSSRSNPYCDWGERRVRASWTRVAERV
jgi:hypothetical protein